MLSSPSNLYVDLRFFKDPKAKSGRLIDWAFAGLGHKQGNLGTWDHWIDSRSDTPANDSGVLSLLSNGDTLEKGTMLDDNGILTTYEEVWRDLVVERGLTTVYVCLHDDALSRFNADKLDNDRKLLDILISSPISPFDICGMLIRIDQHFQALLVNSGQTTAERWILDKEGWRLVYRCGSVLLPSPNHCAPPGDGVAAAAHSVTVDGRQWKLVELHET